MKPDVVLFLIGVNDVGLEQPAIHDTAMQPGTAPQAGALSRGWRALVEYSAVASVVDSLRRSAAAQQAGVVHGNVTHEQLQLDAEKSVAVSQAEIDSLLENHRTSYLPGFRERVELLLDQCTEQEIRPILITQPALYGDTVDPETGVDLGRVMVGQWNGRVRWQILELYNDVTRRVSSERGETCIDLADLMPKDSQYYYDYHHFTNRGAERVGRIVDEALAADSAWIQAFK